MESKSILLLIAAAIGGFVAMNSGVDWGALGQAMQMASGPAQSMDPAARSGDPNDHVEFEGVEWLSTGKVVATTEGPRFMSQVFQGYLAADKGQKLGPITRVTHLEGCEPTWPVPGAIVATVLGSETKLHAGLYTYTQADLVGDVKNFIQAMRTHDQSAERNVRGYTGRKHRFKAMDVAVTETSAPVHLVFQSSYGNRLFNLHIADGVTISGVTLLGGDGSAVANLPVGVPVQAMSAEQLEACDAQLARAPRDGFPLDKPEFVGWSEEVREKWLTRHAAVENYNIWFAAQFGVRSDETLQGYDRGHATLVGPAPDDQTRVAYRPLIGAPITIAGDHFVLARGHGQGIAAYQTQIIEMATELAGGDLDALRPRETAALED